MIDINTTFIELRKECCNKLIKESPDNINRIIAIIREFGRKWDNLSKENSNIKIGGFNKVFKEYLLKTEIPEQWKNALYYLGKNNKEK